MLYEVITNDTPAASSGIITPMFKDIEDLKDNRPSSGTHYTINLPVYEGPLDLLLQLIERAELDITRVALVEVTGPFLEYVHQLKYEKADEVSNFLVVRITSYNVCYTKLLR